MRLNTVRSFLAALTAAVSIVSLGCSSLGPELKKSLPWLADSELDESEFEAPVRLACMWSPDVARVPGHAPVRGVGGKFFFYGERGRAIPVEGQLTVFAYDDTTKETSTQTPSRKFVFTPDQFTQHLGDTELGPSYSVWLPWDPAGGQEKSVSLVPVFTAARGKIIMGQQATAVLPGQKRPRKDTFEVENPIQPVTYNHTSPSQRATNTNPGIVLGAEAKPSIRTTTIDVTPALRQRMMAAGPMSEVAGALPVRQANAELRELAEPRTIATEPARPLPQAQPATRFARPRFPAPREPVWQSGHGRGRWVPNPGAPQSLRPSTQQLQAPPSPVPVAGSIVPQNLY